jgi:hypothetical protein
VLKLWRNVWWDSAGAALIYYLLVCRLASTSSGIFVLSSMTSFTW